MRLHKAKRKKLHKRKRMRANKPERGTVIYYSLAPRRLARRVARANMERAELHRLNKFAVSWRYFVYPNRKRRATK